MPRAPKKSQALAEAIVEAVTSGRWKPGEWLPSRADLGREFDAATGTVAAALDQLGNQGVIEVVPERGAKVPASRARLSRNEGDHSRVVDGERGFRVAMREADREPWDELTSVGEVQALGDVALQLGVPVSTQVLQRARVHGVVVDEGVRRPVMLSWTWVSPAISAQLPILHEASTGPGGMSSRFEELGLQLHWEVVATARAAGNLEAGELNLPAGAPVLDTWRRCFDQDDRILEVTRRMIDPANYDLVFRFGG